MSIIFTSTKLLSSGVECTKDLNATVAKWDMDYFTHQGVKYHIKNNITNISLTVYKEAKLKLLWVAVIKNAEGKVLYKRKYVKFSNFLNLYHFSFSSLSSPYSILWKEN